MWFSENILSSRFMHNVLVKKNCWGSQAGSQLPAAAQLPAKTEGASESVPPATDTLQSSTLCERYPCLPLFTWLFPGTWGDVLLPMQFMFKQSLRFKCSWKLMCK